ncbi:MAG TPA: hypothetical protein VLH86_03895, partial [Patescibacteria group bacterium]|nr:hypothetical protein [Patescibacteria group bacterium]
IYGTYTLAGSTDSFAAGNLFSLNADGAAIFKNSTNSNQALQVQNSAGQAVLSVDTYNNDGAATSANNLIPDGGFEKGTTGWGTKGSLQTAPQQRPNQHHSGRASMYAEGGNAAGGPEYDITLSDALEYQASFYIKNSTTDKPAAGVVQAATITALATRSVLRIRPTSPRPAGRA